MGWSKPFTADELSYIEATYSQLGAAEVARRLGRSRRGVENRVKQLGLEAPRARDRAAAPRAPARAGGDRHDALVELRDLLRANLVGDRVASKDIAKISAEYRAVLADIDALEDGDGGSGAVDVGGIDGIIGVVPLRTA